MKCDIDSKNQKGKIMNKYDLYIGKLITCCCGSNCGKCYEVISDVYENSCGEEVFDIKSDDRYDGCKETVYVDFINEYIEY